MKNTLLSIAGSFARLLPDGWKQAIYRHPGLARPIRRMLNRAVPDGLTAVEVAAGGLAGMTLELDLQAEKYYWLGTYEPELQSAVAELVKPGWVAYDAGANIGYISLLLARAVGETGTVYAFEPLPENQRRLQRNLELNNLQGRVECIPVAVVDHRQEVDFLTGPSHKMGKVQGSAGHENIEYGAAIRAAGISLDEFAAEPGRRPPDLVKMDIEGGEVLALPGMNRLIQTIKPLIFLELHGPEAAQAAWQVFTSAGYQVCRMEAGYPPVASLEQLNWKEYLVAKPVGGEAE
jgi:FkbM family methyltransferase